MRHPGSTRTHDTANIGEQAIVVRDLRNSYADSDSGTKATVLRNIVDLVESSLSRPASKPRWARLRREAPLEASRYIVGT